MKYFLILSLGLLVLMFSGCGAINRIVSGVIGTGTEVCQDKVLYLQFTSGVSVKYKPDGTIATCN